MRVVAPSSEAEMVAVFLRGELQSDRFAPGIRDALHRAGADEQVVWAPDLADGAENELRLGVLDETRAYVRRAGLFGGFPDNVRWRWVVLTREELARVRFIQYDYWLELSGGSRRPVDAARRIRAGVEPFGVPSDGFLELAEEFSQRLPSRELIVVGAGGSAPLVVLEGHARLTALALRPQGMPRELEILLGTSPVIERWGCY
jgi:hypothetical protein